MDRETFVTRSKWFQMDGYGPKMDLHPHVPTRAAFRSLIAGNVIAELVHSLKQNDEVSTAAECAADFIRWLRKQAHQSVCSPFSSWFNGPDHVVADQAPAREHAVSKMHFMRYL